MALREGLFVDGYGFGPVVVVGEWPVSGSQSHFNAIDTSFTRL